MADKDLRARAIEIGRLSEEYDAICDHFLKRHKSISGRFLAAKLEPSFFI